MSPAESVASSLLRLSPRALHHRAPSLLDDVLIRRRVPIPRRPRPRPRRRRVLRHRLHRARHARIAKPEHIHPRRRPASIHRAHLPPQSLSHHPHALFGIVRRVLLPIRGGYSKHGPEPRGVDATLLDAVSTPHPSRSVPIRARRRPESIPRVFRHDSTVRHRVHARVPPLDAVVIVSRVVS